MPVAAGIAVDIAALQRSRSVYGRALSVECYQAVCQIWIGAVGINASAIIRPVIRECTIDELRSRTKTADCSALIIAPVIYKNTFHDSWRGLIHQNRSSLIMRMRIRAVAVAYCKALQYRGIIFSTRKDETAMRITGTALTFNDRIIRTVFGFNHNPLADKINIAIPYSRIETVRDQNSIPIRGQVNGFLNGGNFGRHQDNTAIVYAEFRI